MPTFKELHRVDPTLLIIPEYLPDEVSEPERDSGMTLLDWKKAVAPAAGIEIENKSENDILGLQVLEVLEKGFCSKSVSIGSIIS